jgi:hypothetical protein
MFYSGSACRSIRIFAVATATEQQAKTDGNQRGQELG